MWEGGRVSPRECRGPGDRVSVSVYKCGELVSRVEESV